jgi:hypothetical protein
MTQPIIHDETRGARITAIHAFADWLAANPDVPMPRHSIDVQVHLQNGHDGTEAENLDRVRELADTLGIKADEHLDDRTTVRQLIGGYVSFEVFAWHKTGRDAGELERLRARVAELESVAEALTYSRADEDPQVIRPHSPRLPLHAGAVTDGGALVDVTSAFSAGTDCQVAGSGGWCVEAESCTGACRRPACSPECQAQPEERPCLDSCPAQRAARGES